jgi:hypothetical protein
MEQAFGLAIPRTLEEVCDPSRMAVPSPVLNLLEMQSLRIWKRFVVYFAVHKLLAKNQASRSRGGNIRSI